jgi:hypothetical protein
MQRKARKRMLKDDEKEKKIKEYLDKWKREINTQAQIERTHQCNYYSSKYSIRHCIQFPIDIKYIAGRDLIDPIHREGMIFPSRV